MKIVYLLPGGLFNSGGMERVVSIKANYLAEKFGYDVSIVTTEQMGRPIFYPLSKKIHLFHMDIGIHEKFGKESYIEKCISRFCKTKDYKKALKKLLNDIRPDVTISTLGGLDIGFLNGIRDGSIKIGELHFPGNYRQLMARKLSKAFIPNFVAKIRTWEFKYKCKKLKRLVVLTQEEKSFWNNQTKIEVIPNPLSFSSQEISSVQNKKAIAVGRLAYEKGFDLLIEAWKMVIANHPDWELNIFGNGDQKDILTQLIRNNALDSVIKIHAPVKAIREQYLEHSIFIFSSRYLEALPMVMIEALSCGLPLVAFDAPCGPKDIIKESINGFLVKTGDTKTLSGKIDYLIESETLRQSMGEAAKQSSEEYRLDKIMDRWVTLFEQLQK